ncbi:uncharacterized protein [Oscarella lobularis]|uniref:uncharacterized protein n=1 Tax=Oscarella lobularis TaxID=121494 RepID=UPI0033138D4A
MSFAKKFSLFRHTANRIMNQQWSSVHNAARTGFTSDSVAKYQRGRPDYPLDAVNDLLKNVELPQNGGKILELAAGTGKFTRCLAKALAGSDVKIVSSEPSDAFREKLSDVPSVEVIACAAESIPLSDSSLDLVIAAQSFHWFANVSALKEIHRVLKPAKYFAMIWNRIDTSVAWVNHLEYSIISRYYSGSDVPRYVDGKWSRVFEQFCGFDSLQKSVRSRGIVQEGSKELIINRVLSISVIASRPEEEQRKVAAEVEDLLTTHQDTRGLSTYSLPYATDLCWTKKL